MPAPKSHLHTKGKVMQEADAGGGVSESNHGNATPSPAPFPTRLTAISTMKQHQKESESHSVASNSLQLHGLYQTAGVGSLSLLRGSSQPQDQTQVSCIAGGFFTS